MATTGGRAHLTTVPGLVDGSGNDFYVRCLDAAAVATPADPATTSAVDSPPDTTPPVRSGGQPMGALPAGTTQTTLALTTNEAATCRYSSSAGVSYNAMTRSEERRGGTAHTTPGSSHHESRRQPLQLRSL